MKAQGLQFISLETFNMVFKKKKNPSYLLSK